MRDLTDRALDTAIRAGRGVRRRPRRPPARGEHLDQDRPGRRRRLGRERGVRRPRPRRRRVGLRRIARPDRARKPTASPPRPSGSPGPARPPCATQTQLDDRPPAHGTLRDAARGGPVRGPARDEDRATCSPPTRRQPASRASPSPSRCYAAQREWKTFAATDGSFTEQVITHVGAGIEANAVDGDEHQRRSYPDSGGGWRRRRLRDHPRPRPRRAGRAAGRGGRRAAHRAAVPVGSVHDRPRPVAALPPGPRVVRPPDRARSRLRDRGVATPARAS